MKRSAVVVGATGLIGKELVQLLLSDPDYSVVTWIVRRPTGVAHPKLQEQVVNFDQLEQMEINLKGADVFCVLGTTIKKAGSQGAFRHVDYTYPLALGRMAKEQGARQFLIVTAMGANQSSRVFYNRVKGEVEVALRELGLRALHIFRPSLLLGNREEFRLGERVAASFSGVLSPLFVGALRKYRPIEARDVAKAMVLTAQRDLAGSHVYESNQMASVHESE